MYWECNELQASESFPYGFPQYGRSPKADFKTVSPFHVPIPDHHIYRAPASKIPNMVVGAGFRVWNAAVESFSRLTLTYQTDKLVEISAIAREMQPLMQCKYLAGLWEIDLIFQLPWSCDESGFNLGYISGGRAQIARPDQYQAPSWSWASVNWNLCFHSYNFHTVIPLAELVDNTCSPSSCYLFYIVLRGGSYVL
jgi:hypothetical protein